MSQLDEAFDVLDSVATIASKKALLIASGVDITHNSFLNPYFLIPGEVSLSFLDKKLDAPVSILVNVEQGEVHEDSDEGSLPPLGFSVTLSSTEEGWTVIRDFVLEALGSLVMVDEEIEQTLPMQFVEIAFTTALLEQVKAVATQLIIKSTETVH